MINYELSFLIAISAFVYTNILTEPEMLFNSLYNYLDVIFTGKYRFVFKILIHCEKCLSGQLAFWIYLWVNYNFYLSNNFLSAGLNHIFFISFTILIATILNIIYKKTQQ